MFKNKFRILSLVLSLVLLVSAIAPLTSIADDPLAQTAINELKTAWQNLGRETSVLYAIPSEGDRKTADDNIQTQMKHADSEIGPYYMHKTLDWNTSFVPAGDKFYDLTDKDNLSFRFIYRLTTGPESSNSVNGSKFCFQVIGKNSTQYNNYVSIWSSSTSFRSAKFTFNGSSNSNMGDGEIKSIKVAPADNNTKYMQMGCIYAYYTERVPLPENTDGWTVERWIDAAESLSLDDYDTAEFETKLTALREFSEQGKAYNDLIDAWKEMKYTEYEVVALPKNGTLYDVDDATYTKMGIEAGTFIGDQYMKFSFGNAVGFTPEKGWDNTDLSKYSSIFAYIRTFSDDQYTQYDGGSYYVNFYKPDWNSYLKYPTTSNSAVYKLKDTPTTTKLKNIELKRNSGAQYMMITPLIGEYTAVKDMPEKVALMTLRELIDVATKVDSTGVDAGIVAAFTNAIATARTKVTPIVVDEEDVNKAKENLLKTWSELSREEKELWAVPVESERKATDENATTLLGLPESAIGPYYAQKDLATGLMYFAPPDGKDNYDSLAGAVKVIGNCAFYNNDMQKVSGGDGKCVFQFDHTANQYPNNYVTSFNITATNVGGAFKKYFDGATPSIVSFQKEGTSKANVVVFGCLYVIRNVKAELPEGAEGMSLPLLVSIANNVDTSTFNELLVTEFETALETALKLSEKMELAASEKLIIAADAAGVTLDTDDLVNSAMSTDLSAVSEKDDFLKALYEIRLFTEEGFNIDGVVKAWETLGKELPENYAQLTAEKWIELASAVDTSSADKTVAAEFKTALRNLIYFFSGQIDTDDLKVYVDKAAGMNSDDFTKQTWSKFESLLNKSKDIVANPTGYSQRETDATLDELLSAWGELKYYVRSLYLDINDYYKNDRKVKVTTVFKEEHTYTRLEKDLKLSNGLDCASYIFGTTQNDAFQFGGQELISLNGYEYIEFYVKLDKDFKLSSNGQLTVQFMCKGGTEWFNYYISIPKSWVGGDWQKIEIPISEFQNYKFGKRVNDVYLNATNNTVDVVKFFVQKGEGSLWISSIAAAKTENATSGVAPSIPKINIYRPPVVVRPAPTNPFDGLDRGDPWGDEYRKNLSVKEDNPINNDTVITEPEETPSYTLFIVIGIILVVLLVGGAVLVVVMKKKNGGKTK